MPLLGSAATFAILAGTGVAATGSSEIAGDVGVSPGGSVTGFPPGLIGGGGAIHAADALALQAQRDLGAAYDELAARACDFNLTDADLLGSGLTGGVYCLASPAQLSGKLWLRGGPGTVHVFRIAGAFATAPNSTFEFLHGGSQDGVFWQISGAAALGRGTQLPGTILARDGISLGTGTSVGRALVRTGGVTLDWGFVRVGDLTGCAGAVCGGACVITSTDAANCGACGHACAAGEACAAGACAACAGTMCGGACVDTATARRDCGACGRACTAGQSCTGGVCGACAGTTCGSECVDTATDGNNCGACGRSCGQAGPGTCTRGVCDSFGFALAPGSLDFGAVAAGQTVSRTFTVTNESRAARLFWLDHTMNMTTYFVAFSAYPFALAPAASQTVTVTYGPAGAMETLRGAVMVYSTPGLSYLPVSSTPLVSTPAAVALAPASLDFGAVAVGATGSRTSQLSNGGSAPLRVSAVGACAGTGAAFSWSPRAPFDVAPGGAVALTVTYAPTAAGTDAGCIAIASDDPVHPRAELAVAGTGSTPVAPPLVDPGTAPPANSTSAPVSAPGAAGGCSIGSASSSMLLALGALALRRRLGCRSVAACALPRRAEGEAAVATEVPL